MHLLKIKLRRIKETGNYYCSTSFTSDYQMQLLGLFLGDFGNNVRIEFLKKILHNPFQDGTCGNISTIDKLENGKLAISDLLEENDNAHLEISPEDLLKILDLYINARESHPTPDEIIIKLDESASNPIIEIVGKPCTCTQNARCRK